MKKLEFQHHTRSNLYKIISTNEDWTEELPSEMSQFFF